MLKLKKIEAEKYPEYPEQGARFLPTIYLDSRQIAEIRDWEVGEEYTLILKVKQTSKSENDKEKDGKVNSVRAEFDVIAYKAISEDYENMSSEDFKEMMKNHTS